MLTLFFFDSGLGLDNKLAIRGFVVAVLTRHTPTKLALFNLDYFAELVRPVIYPHPHMFADHLVIFISFANLGEEIVFT